MKVPKKLYDKTIEALDHAVNKYRNIKEDRGWIIQNVYTDTSCLLCEIYGIIEWCKKSYYNKKHACPLVIGKARGCNAFINYCRVSEFDDLPFAKESYRDDPTHENYLEVKRMCNVFADWIEGRKKIYIKECGEANNDQEK